MVMSEKLDKIIDVEKKFAVSFCYGYTNPIHYWKENKYGRKYLRRDVPCWAGRVCGVHTIESNFSGKIICWFRELQILLDNYLLSA